MTNSEGMGEAVAIKPWGAFIGSGPCDWQILQQDENGFATITLAGHWVAKDSLSLFGGKGGRVEARLVREDSGAPVNPELNWRSMATTDNGEWEGELPLIPAGGPYRLETRFNPKGNKQGEWSLRGDIRHFLGVGDLWLIAGQSNAAGYGRSPADDPPELGLHMLRLNGGWSLACHPLSDGTNTVFPDSRETYNTGHSPFLHFARALRKELHYPIGLLPGALGGSALEAWHPQKGPLFLNLKSIVAEAGGRVKGIAWYQGESDAKSGQAENYLPRFQASVLGWRKELGQLDLPILTVQLARYRSANINEQDKEWSTVREAQRQAALQDPKIFVVPALDLPLDDTIHIATAGNMVLGERLARCALGAVYGSRTDATPSNSPKQASPWRPPDLVEAKMEGTTGVRLQFSPVFSRLDNHDPKAKPFRVEDDAGFLEIEKAVFFQSDSVKLFLARAPQGQVRVSCGYGEDPEMLPVDVERQMPVLAFYRVFAAI